MDCATQTSRLADTLRMIIAFQTAFFLSVPALQKTNKKVQHTTALQNYTIIEMDARSLCKAVLVTQIKAVSLLNLCS